MAGNSGNFLCGEMYEVTTLIRFKNVTKAYPIGEVTIQALAGVDFSILENSSLF